MLTARFWKCFASLYLGGVLVQLYLPLHPQGRASLPPVCLRPLPIPVPWWLASPLLQSWLLCLSQTLGALTFLRWHDALGHYPSSFSSVAVYTKRCPVGMQSPGQFCIVSPPSPD